MHRTQILLEEPHYHFLQSEAQRLRVSMSEILRRLVAREMAACGDEAEDPFEGLAGIADSGTALSEPDQDRVIYNLPQR